jgi:phage terminase large subunit-like protein
VAVNAYHDYKAGAIIAEENYGGQMVESNVKNIDKNVRYESVHATRGKAVRAEPVAGLYEDGRIIHVGSAAKWAKAEDELAGFNPLLKQKSPNRLDWIVWLVLWLLGDSSTGVLDFYAQQAQNLPEDAQKRIRERLEKVRNLLEQSRKKGRQ